MNIGMKIMVEDQTDQTLLYSASKETEANNKNIEVSIPQPNIKVQSRSNFALCPAFLQYKSKTNSRRKIEFGSSGHQDKALQYCYSESRIGMENKSTLHQGKNSNSNNLTFTQLNQDINTSKIDENEIQKTLKMPSKPDIRTAKVKF